MTPPAAEQSGLIALRTMPSSSRKARAGSIAHDDSVTACPVKQHVERCMARTRDSRGFAGVLKIPSSKLLFCVPIPLGLPLHRVLEKIAIKNSALRSSGSSGAHFLRCALHVNGDAIYLVLSVYVSDEYQTQGLWACTYVRLRGDIGVMHLFSSCQKLTAFADDSTNLQL